MASLAEPHSQDSSQENDEKQQGPRAGERSRLVQRLLDGGSDLPAFLNDLLGTMAVTVAGTEAACFGLERAGQQEFALKPIHHIRQDESDAQTRSAALEAFQSLVKPCIVQGKDGAIDLGNATALESEPQYCLITLLRDGQQIVAVAAVITRCLNLERARQRLLSMQLVAGYFELFTLKRNAESNRQVAQSHQQVLQLSRAVADAEGFISAAMNLCNELANATGATRVSLGWLKGRLIRIKALSHTEDFDKKQELVVQLEKAMEECYDQDSTVLYDPTGVAGGNEVTRQAAVLSRAQGGHVVLSLPLRRHADIEGVITLEFLTAERLTPKMLESLTISVDLLAPQLYDRHENDHWLIVKAAISTKRTAEAALGPKHWIAKLVTFGVILLLLGLTNFVGLFNGTWFDMRPMYKVTAPMSFEPLEKRSLDAPFDGQISKVYKRAGEHVKAGDPLFELRTDDLVKQKAQSDAEALYHRYKADAYQADNTKIADMQSERAQENEAEAKSALLQSQIDRAVVRAPFDCEILEDGNLMDKVDTTVKEGEEKMIIANLSPARKLPLPAPFDGQVVEVLKHPGDSCVAGDEIFALNTDELHKQKSQIDAEAAEHKLKALALAGDTTKAAEMKDEQDQQAKCEAKSSVLKSQIDNAVVRAPFDGKVLEVNLAKNDRVKQGDNKVIVSTLEPLVASLTVNERDIQDVKEGSKGTLATTSKPLDKVDFVVDRIPPLGQPKEGSNVFTIYATPEQVNPTWRPGMAGEARINVGKRTLAWMWTHRLMEFIRLKTWM